MKSPRVLTLAVAAAAALLLSACASGSLSGAAAPAESPGQSSDLTPITIGVLPIATPAAVNYGIDTGIFEKHGLDASLQQGDGGAALLPAVSSGSLQFAIGNPLSVMTAASRGLDMRIVSGFSLNKPSPDDPEGITVLADSGITSWKDLEGKTVAINALSTLGDLGVKTLVERDGGDPDTVKFLEIPFPDQLAQLEQGNIDASWIPEPFLSKWRASEGVEYIGSVLGFIPNLNSMVTFTSGPYADEHPEVVERFRAAVEESTAAMMADEELFREQIVAFTGMDAEVVADINLERVSVDLDTTSITDLSDSAVKYGFIEAAPDLEKLLPVESP